MEINKIGIKHIRSPTMVDNNVNKNKYINEFLQKQKYKNDKREGRGIETWPDGERFEGYFINDLRNGKGVY